MWQRYIYDIFLWIDFRRRGTVPQSKDFVSVRLDHELKKELLQASDLERRSLSNFCRLLLEFAWAQYLQAGSMHELISRQERTLDRSSE